MRKVFLKHSTEFYYDKLVSEGQPNKALSNK